MQYSFHCNTNKETHNKIKQHAVIDSRLRPGAVTCHVDETTLSDVWLVPPAGKRRLWFAVTHYIIIITCMESSTKPEVHNVLHCRQRTEPRPQVTCTQNFGFWDMRADRQTNKQPDRQTHIHIDTLITIICFPAAVHWLTQCIPNLLDSRRWELVGVDR